MSLAPCSRGMMTDVLFIASNKQSDSNGDDKRNTHMNGFKMLS